jgi:hypothetical protein
MVAGVADHVWSVWKLLEVEVEPTEAVEFAGLQRIRTAV